MVSENTIEILIFAQDAASNIMNSISDKAGGLGDKFMDMGGAMTLATAGITASLAAATTFALSYDESITNTAAVLGLAREEQAALSQEILDFSRTTTAGPQQVADAFYDIAGGVADATTHMAILEAATNTAEAGNANLSTTTAGLISIMNSYTLSSEEAAFASDVLTQTVNDGVGDMNSFAAALPEVAGIANQVGISLETLGASMAFLTTQGFTASESSTKLKAILSSMLNPNLRMRDAFEELGFASGEAAIESLGLVGALEAINSTNTVTEYGLAATLGSMEALTGAIVLTGDEAAAAMDSFADSVDGATERAQAIQLTSPAQQIRLLTSSLSALGIQAGNVLLPSLNNIVRSITPVINSIFDWVAVNPELTTTIISVAGGISALGPLITGIGFAINVLASPITMIIGALAGLALAWNTNFLGIRDVAQPILDNISQAFSVFTNGIGIFVQDINNVGLPAAILAAFGIGPAAGGESWVESIIAAFLGASGQSTGTMRELAVNITDTLGNVITFVMSTVIPGLQNLVNWFVTDGLPLAMSFLTDIAIPSFLYFINILQGIWTNVQPMLFALADWFTTSALPTINQFITGIIVPAIQNFILILQNIWTETQPLLIALFDWFTITALPAVTNFINEIVIPVIEGFISVLIRIWNDVSPFLFALADWFITSALPAIANYITTFIVPIFEFFIELIAGIWVAVQPTLESIYDWFVTSGLPFILVALEAVITGFEIFTAIIADIWTTIEPVLKSVFDWFVTNGMPIIDGAINTTIGVLEHVIDVLTNLWTTVSPHLEQFKAGIEAIFNWIQVNVIDPIIEAINSIGRTWEDVQRGISDAAAAFGIDLGMSSATSRDVGGTGYAGQSYLIGSGAQPELFVPRTAGTFIPNADRLFEGNGNSGPQNSYQISVSVNERELLTQEDAKTNGEMLGKRIMEELIYRG